ncbi:MAG: hypothetical protein EU547_02205 [Promethearchaeota archaeon]|nr:MAG: hypothetical protein EU547_02205 [Candidatus Lokiarchaeota archaeon]
MDRALLVLDQLFTSIGITELGIEKIYNFLLKNKRIDDLKKVCKQLDLTLKRGYKINSVLSSLGLVQIYDRPMKIILRTPVVQIWQKILNQRIEDLKNELNESVRQCERTFDNFIETFNLKEEEISQEPVEFINYSLDSIESLYYPFLAQNECKLALGIRYENILMIKLKNESIDKINGNYKDIIYKGMKKISENLQNIDISVVFNNDLIQELLNTREYRIILDILDDIKFRFNVFQVKVTTTNLSNFCLVDGKLSQPSFDPSNKLLGAYISRNMDIYNVFADKFDELFKNGISINEYIKENDDIKTNPLTELQKFVLCLL